MFAFLLAWLFEIFGEQYWVTISRFVAVPAALVGAFIAWYISRSQIAHNTSRDLAAWKAVLPLALSDFAGVAQNGMLIAAKKHPDAPQNSRDIKRLLSIQETTLQTLQNCIKNSDPITEK